MLPLTKILSCKNCETMLLLWSLNHILLKSYPFSSADTSSRQPRLTAWLCLGVSKTSTSSRHLRLLYSSGRVALGKTQVGADLGLHHSGNPRASIPSRQLQTMSEHHHLAPTQLILHGWQRLVEVVIASLCSWLACINPFHWSANSNQGSTTRGGCTQLTQRVYLEYPAWVIGEAMPLDPTGHLLH